MKWAMGNPTIIGADGQFYVAAEVSDAPIQGFQRVRSLYGVDARGVRTTLHTETGAQRSVGWPLAVNQTHVAFTSMEWVPNPESGSYVQREVLVLDRATNAVTRLVNPDGASTLVDRELVATKTAIYFRTQRAVTELESVATVVRWAGGIPRAIITSKWNSQWLATDDAVFLAERSPTELAVRRVDLNGTASPLKALPAAASLVAVDRNRIYYRANMSLGALSSFRVADGTDDRVDFPGDGSAASVLFGEDHIFFFVTSGQGVVYRAPRQGGARSVFLEPGPLEALDKVWVDGCNVYWVENTKRGLNWRPQSF